MSDADRPKPRPPILGVRARVVRGPDDQGRWYWRIWRRDNARAETLRSGWYSITDVEREQARLAVDPEAAQRRQGARTVYDLVDYWIAAREDDQGLSANTVRINRHTAKRLAGSKKAGLTDLGRTLMTSVNRRTLERWRDAQQRAGVAASSVRLGLRTLRQAWTWGREVGLVDGECPRVTVRGGKAREKYTPERAEVAAVLAELDGWARRAVLLYAATGARLDEIASLTWSRCNLERGVLTVRGKRGERKVPLTGGALLSLRAAWTAAGSPADGRVLSEVTYKTSRRLDDRLKVACKRAGVPYFPPGGLRRAAVVSLYRAGVDPGLAGAIVGHSPTVALRNYRQIAGSEMAEAVARAGLGGLGDNVVEGPWVSQTVSQHGS